jgi:hypothetical protein
VQVRALGKGPVQGRHVDSVVGKKPSPHCETQAPDWRRWSPSQREMDSAVHSAAPSNLVEQARQVPSMKREKDELLPEDERKRGVP